VSKAIRVISDLERAQTTKRLNTGGLSIRIEKRLEEVRRNP